MLIHFHSRISSPIHPSHFFFPITIARTTSTKIMSSNLQQQQQQQQQQRQQQQQQQQQQQHLSQVLKYHNQTKHSFNKYARGPHGLDWANQPNPFRLYPPSPLLPLQHLPPHPPLPSDPLYPSLFHSLPTPPQPLSLSTLSQFLYDSLSLSAWKTTGFSTWSLRVNPSSGNLHPTEAYIISPSLPPLSDSPFVSHYAPKQHSLELRSQFPPSSSASSFFRRFFPENSFLVGLSSIFWRESWKYGERAFRYCNHDVGHAIAAVAFAAAALGWDVKLLDGLGYSDLEKVMGLGFGHGFQIPPQPIKGRLPELELEHPDCLLLVFPSSSQGFTINYTDLSAAIAELFSSLQWNGSPNSLSKDHVCWDIIYRTAEAVKKPLTIEAGFSAVPFQGSNGSFSEGSYKDLTVREVVRKRRSAVDMDGVHVMERGTFYQILLHCLPSGSSKKQGKQLAFPYRVLLWDSEIHAVLFVHRVKELPMGLYFLVRNEGHFDSLKRAMKSEFKWEKPEGCPAELPLYRLARGDCKELSKRLSCHQDIASDGCFSLGMVAHFEPTFREKDAWMYPRLFWESGILGQVLYLEAHAVGISATGIGCYFDDAVHDVLGLTGSEFQSLYHFTLGSPVVDKRIMSLPAYPGPNIDA
ncbi:uncharacterized protein LOC131248360 isoform X1 [Magnolia sinica]|uniref:uncharacterized protein LOC131248360 isoform X1 n=1 Tax=Magnolia sinica TaxID=86752 RepID=UPI002659F5D7|nr:uncharacterized protein LOC131248360 isoform X1 [Magnolia sinica]